jgi:hypothetical protein
MNTVEKERLTHISTLLKLKSFNIQNEIIENTYKDNINFELFEYILNLPNNKIVKVDNIINKIKNNDYSFSKEDKDIYELIKKSILDTSKSKFDVQREKIIGDFNQKKYDFEKYNPSKKFIYENQKQCSIEIMEKFKQDKKAVSLIALPQVGKTGTFIYFIYLALTDNNNDVIFLTENTYILTGMNDKSWLEQTKNDLFDALKNNIYHLGTIKRLKNELSNKINSRILIVLDESQIATSENQKISNLFNEIENDNINDNKIYYLVVSATPSSPLVDLNKWKDKHSKVFLKPPISYIGFKNFIEEKRIGKSEIITEKYLQKIQNLILSRYKNYKYHIFRLSEKNREIIYEWIKKNNYGKQLADAENSLFKIDFILNNKPSKHTIILIKNFWRAGKRMNDKHIGIVYEHNSKLDLDITAQGLIARFCGNDKQKDNFEAPYFLCNINAIYDYIKFMEEDCNFENADYKSRKLKVVDNELIYQNPSFVNSILKINDDDNGFIKKEDYCTIPIEYNINNEIYKSIYESTNKKLDIIKIIKNIDYSKYKEIKKYNCVKCTIPGLQDENGESKGDYSYKRHIIQTRELIENNKYKRPTDLPKKNSNENCYIVYVDCRSKPKKLYLWIYHGKKKIKTIFKINAENNLKCRFLNT